MEPPVSPRNILDELDRTLDRDDTGWGNYWNEYAADLTPLLTPQDWQTLAEQWRSKPPRWRRHYAEILPIDNHDDALPILIEMVQAPNDELAITAADCLRDFAPVSVAAALTPRLREHLAQIAQTRAGLSGRVIGALLDSLEAAESLRGKETSPMAFSFSPSTRGYLTQAGWNEARWVDPDGWVQSLRSRGYPVSEAVIAFLRRFGGLRVRPPHPAGGDDVFHFDPIAAARNNYVEGAEENSERVGQPLCLIGEAASGYLAVLMAPTGEVFVSLGDVLRRAGDSGEEAIEAFCTGASLPEVLEGGPGE